jgi:hypothetical protein
MAMRGEQIAHAALPAATLAYMQWKKIAKAAIEVVVANFPTTSRFLSSRF